MTDQVLLVNGPYNGMTVNNPAMIINVWDPSIPLGQPALRYIIRSLELPLTAYLEGTQPPKPR